MQNEEAIALMRTSTDIEDWNEKREIVRTKLTLGQWKQLHYTIDGSGLVVEVLGRDKTKSRNQPVVNNQ
jgi:hypothetical protein